MSGTTEVNYDTPHVLTASQSLVSRNTELRNLPKNTNSSYSPSKILVGGLYFLYPPNPPNHSTKIYGVVQDE